MVISLLSSPTSPTWVICVVLEKECLVFLDPLGDKMPCVLCLYLENHFPHLIYCNKFILKWMRSCFILKKTLSILSGFFFFFLLSPFKSFLFVSKYNLFCKNIFLMPWKIYGIRRELFIFLLLRCKSLRISENILCIFYCI